MNIPSGLLEVAIAALLIQMLWTVITMAFAVHGLFAKKRPAQGIRPEEVGAIARAAAQQVAAGLLNRLAAARADGNHHDDKLSAMTTEFPRGSARRQRPKRSRGEPALPC